jgi:hypothetical protein
MYSLHCIGYNRKLYPFFLQFHSNDATGRPIYQLKCETVTDTAVDKICCGYQNEREIYLFYGRNLSETAGKSSWLIGVHFRSVKDPMTWPYDTINSATIFINSEGRVI